MGMYSNEDFSKMKFNVYEVPHGEDLLHKFKVMYGLDSFADYGEADRNKVIRYVLYLYDNESPLIQRYSNLSRRKEEAVLLSGFDVRKDKERIEELNTLNDQRVVNMIIDFLKFINNKKWAMIISNEQTFYEYQTALLSKVYNYKTDKDKLQAITVKGAMMQECDLISDRLDRYYKEVFKDDTVVKEVQRQRATPEAQSRS